MNREQYLSQLNQYLKKLPKPDYENAMEYFTEYFEEAGEKRAMEELGTPKEAAADILNNLLGQNAEVGQAMENQQAASLKRTVSLSMLSILVSPLSLGKTILLLLFLFIFLCISILCTASILLFAWMGGKYFLLGLAAISHSLSGACALMGIGAIGIGGGILMFTAMILLDRWLLSKGIQLIQKYTKKGGEK